MIRPGTVERAFQLAQTSCLTSVELIRRRLKAEGYVDWEFQLSGLQIRRDLRAALAARKARELTSA